MSFVFVSLIFSLMRGIGIKYFLILAKFEMCEIKNKY